MNIEKKMAVNQSIYRANLKENADIRVRTPLMQWPKRSKKKKKRYKRIEKCLIYLIDMAQRKDT